VYWSRENFICRLVLSKFLLLPHGSNLKYLSNIIHEWRKLYIQELNDLYSSPTIVWLIKSRRMRWAGHVARMGERRGVYRILVGKPEGKKPHGRPRRKWKDNIKMDLQEVVCEDMDWMELAQDRDSWRALVAAAMNLPVL
jgi:hypothetical protein